MLLAIFMGMTMKTDLKGFVITPPKPTSSFSACGMLG
jgi:hypothetical protein